MPGEIDPEIRAILMRLLRGREEAHELPISVLRAGHELENAELCGPGEPVAGVRDVLVATPTGDVPVRIYLPRGPAPHLSLAYFHGGGWAIGSIDSFDAVCRALANASGALVASVDYRLAPEHRFPAALDDCLAVTRWLSEHAQELGAATRAVAVGGDSAGGGLAAVVARRLRDDPEVDLRWQLLIYPTCDALQASESNTLFAQGFGLTKAAMRRYWDLYLDGVDGMDPDASPLYAQDLEGLAPALILTAGYDVLRDEGEAYGRSLERAGVPVVRLRYETAIHGFWRWQQAAALARTAVADVGAILGPPVDIS
ncbi:MAG: lipase/esterase [Solirubrobacterales bacterium]|nr:lipase/esterase [Solirubrobacterales bacterium]